MKPSLFIIGSKRFHTPMLQRNQNKTSVISKNYIKTKPKRFKLRQDFLKTKQNFYLFQKKLEIDQNKSFWTKFF